MAAKNGKAYFRFMPFLSALSTSSFTSTRPPDVEDNLDVAAGEDVDGFITFVNGML